MRGSGGVFLVTVDEKVIFCKKEMGRFPNDGEVAEIIRTKK